MLALATTLLTVYRGVTVDEYGDDTDSQTVLYRDIPASLLEQSQQVLEQDSNTPMTIRFITGRVGAGTDIQTNDRLLDQATNLVYEVTDVTKVSNPLVNADIKLSLKLIGPDSTT